eukprot:1161295-Pelagomonas_calceolata.AAC.1
MQPENVLLKADKNASVGLVAKLTGEWAWAYTEVCLFVLPTAKEVSEGLVAQITDNEVRMGLIANVTGGQLACMSMADKRFEVLGTSVVLGFNELHKLPDQRAHQVDLQGLPSTWSPPQLTPTLGLPLSWAPPQLTQATSDQGRPSTALLRCVAADSHFAFRGELEEWRRSLRLRRCPLSRNRATFKQGLGGDDAACTDSSALLYHNLSA